MVDFIFGPIASWFGTTIPIILLVGIFIMLIILVLRG